MRIVFILFVIVSAIRLLLMRIIYKLSRKYNDNNVKDCIIAVFYLVEARGIEPLASTRASTSVVYALTFPLQNAHEQVFLFGSLHKPDQAQSFC